MYILAIRCESLYLFSCLQRRNKHLIVGNLPFPQQITQKQTNKAIVDQTSVQENKQETTNDLI